MRKRIKRLNMIATRKDGFVVKGHFKSIKITQEANLWVNADGREFICDSVTIMTEPEQVTT